MAALAGRVLRLERRGGVNAPCDACGGHGQDQYQVVFEPDEPPEPRGCPRCGRVGTVYRTVFARDDERDDEREDAACA